MKMENIRQGIGSFWDSVTEGWDRLRQSAASALTRFRPGEKANLPKPDEVDDVTYLAGPGWAMLGEDLFEDDNRLVLRLEAPGLEKSDFNIQVYDDALIVQGEKRFERENTDGRWRVLQCAYGSFHRVVPLPVPVKAEQARATYRNGVLKVELPKVQPSRPRRVSIRID